MSWIALILTLLLEQVRATPSANPVYAGATASKALEVIDLILAEFALLKQILLSDEELTRAKDQLKGNMLLGLESSNSRMANLARQEMYFHQFITVDEVIARVDAVQAEEVQAMARRLFVADRIAVTLLGRLDGVKLKRERLVPRNMNHFVY